MYINLYKMFTLERGVEYGNAYFCAGIRPHKSKSYEIQQAAVILPSLKYMGISYNIVIRAIHVIVTFAYQSVVNLVLEYNFPDPNSFHGIYLNPKSLYFDHNTNGEILESFGM